MNASRPILRTLTISRPPAPSRSPRSFLHSSTRRRRDNVDQNKNQVSSSKVAVKEPLENPRPENAEKALPTFTEQEYKALEEKYTPEQIEVIKAGEAAVDPQDIVDQGIINRGHMTIDYSDDFASIRPVVDKPQRISEHESVPNLRVKTEKELNQKIEEFRQTIPRDANDPSLEWKRFIDDVAKSNQSPEEAPPLPKISDPLIQFQARASRAGRDDDEMTPYYHKLEKITGMTVGHMKKLRIKTMVQKRVVNQTRMGKIPSIYFLIVAGNGKGLLGLGEGKAKDADEARRQGVMNAIRNLKPIRRYEDRTIFGDVKGKIGATELELFNRPPGIKPTPNAT